MPWPALLVALPLAAGALTGIALRWTPDLPLACLALLVWGLGLAAWRRGDAPGAVWAATACLFAAGVGLGGRAERAARQPPLGALFDQRAVIEADAPEGGASLRVVEPALTAELEGRLRADAGSGSGGLAGTGLELEVERLRLGEVWTAARGGVSIVVGGAPPGDRAGQWRKGRRIRAPALLRRAGRNRIAGIPDRRVTMARRGIALVGSVKSAWLVEVVARGSWIEEAAGASRAWIRRTLDRHVGRWSRRGAGIVTAILVGDRAGLDPEVERRLQAAGTYHVIAISGGNIAILAGLLVAVLAASGLGPRATGGVAIVGLLGYAQMVGAEASVVRATIMAVTYLAARLLDHRSSPGNAIAASGAMVVATTPLALTDVGFALTFGATLGIVAGGEVAAPRLPGGRAARWFVLMLLASLSAELALLPITARVFSRVTAAGLLLNFVAVPAMGVVQIAGMAVLAAAWLPAASNAAGALAAAAAWGIVESGRAVELVPWLSPRVAPPSGWAVAAYYAGWTALLSAALRRTRPRGTSRARRAAGGALVLAGGAWIIVAPAPLAGARAGSLRVTWFDVGHADAALVRFPDATTLLVDAAGTLGPSTFDIGQRVVSPAVWAAGVRRLDLFAITHGDPDHIGGALAVIADLRPREVWEGIPVASSVPLARVREWADGAGARWRQLAAGERFGIGGVSVRVWHPPPAEWERRKVRNDDSLVIELRWRHVGVLLTGDIGAAVERDLAGRIEPAPLVVMKVPHHGSAGSSDPALIARLRPRAAILTTGRGSWIGRDVERRYRAAGAAWFRTDEDGTVTMETDGRRVELTTLTGRRVVVE